MEFRDFATFYFDFVPGSGNNEPFFSAFEPYSHPDPGNYATGRGDRGKANSQYFDPIRREYLKDVISLEVLNSSPKSYLPNNMTRYLAHKVFLKIFDVKDAVIVE